jgi:hypothetical protein
VWKIEPKDKHIQKNKQDNIHIYIQNMFVIVKPCYGTWEGRKGKENDGESKIIKYITSLQVEGIMICTESCRITGIWREGVRENNGRN